MDAPCAIMWLGHHREKAPHMMLLDHRSLQIAVIQHQGQTQLMKTSPESNQSHHHY